MKRKNYFLFGFGWLLFGAFIISIMAFAVMYLWNWLIPELFAGPVITFIQSIGLILLAKLLTGFGGWKKHGGWSEKHNYRSHYWKQRWDAKCANMTTEEKEKFKSMYYDRCGWGRYENKKEEQDEMKGEEAKG